MDSILPKPDGVSEGGEPNLRLQGTVDAFVAPELLASLQSAFAGGGMIRVDCSALERLDTSGLQILVAWVEKLTTAGRLFSFDGVPDAVRRFVALAGAERILFPAGTEPSELQQSALSADECAVAANAEIAAALGPEPNPTTETESGVAIQTPTYTGTDTLDGAETETAETETAETETAETETAETETAETETAETVTETENYEQEASFG